MPPPIAAIRRASNLADLWPSPASSKDCGSTASGATIAWSRPWRNLGVFERIGRSRGARRLLRNRLVEAIDASRGAGEGRAAETARPSNRGFGEQSCRGKTVVATGATSGIGEVAVARAGEDGRADRLRRARRAAGRGDAGRLETAAPGRGTRCIWPTLQMAETRRVGLGDRRAGARIDVLINNAGAVFPTGARRPRAWR